MHPERPATDTYYQNVFLAECTVCFALNPNHQKRGVGRVGHEIFQELVRRSSTHRKKNTRRRVYFFHTIHLCPEILPHPNVLLVHDVIPLLFPESFPHTVKRWHQEYLPIIRQADKIITITHSSAADIAIHTGIPISAIEVIHNGIASLPNPDNNSDPELANADARVPKPYVVMIGASDDHKNPEVILRALAHPSCTNVSLVFIGRLKKISGLVHHLQLQQRVFKTGYLSDAEMAKIVSNASALVFPSLYEGFGLPPFEAASLGVPSICSYRQAMTELLETSVPEKQAVLFCEPDDEEQWAAAICSLVTNTPLREQLVNNMLKVMQALTWEQHGARFEKVLHQIAATRYTTMLKHKFDRQYSQVQHWLKYFLQYQRQQHEKYFHETGDKSRHYDARFYQGDVSKEKRRKILIRLLKNFVELAEPWSVDVILMHGALIGWAWNKKLLPWDADIDICLFYEHLERLRQNRKQLVYKRNRFLLDINPNFVHRHTRNQHPQETREPNRIDARFICKKTGVYLDITALFADSSQTPLRFNTKCPHSWLCEHILPLQKDQLENIPVSIPHRFVAILEQEYGKQVLQNPVFKNWLFDGQHWVRKRINSL